MSKKFQVEVKFQYKNSSEVSILSKECSSLNKAKNQLQADINWLNTKGHKIISAEIK